MADGWQTIAQALASARRDGRQIDAPNNAWPPADMAAAERIRDAASAAMGEPAAGWKIGATSPEAQRIMGCDGPFYGPMYRFQMFTDGSTTLMPAGMLGVECEFAFLIGQDQPSQRSDWDRDSIADLVDSCHPALEFVGRRVAGTGFPPVLEAVADFALNIGFVHGPAIEGWRDIDLAEAAVRGFVGGRETNAGHGRNVLGHPLNALAWLANRLSLHGSGLKAGQWVSTGTCLGVVAAEPGTLVRGDYGSLGSVEIRFSAG